MDTLSIKKYNNAHNKIKTDKDFLDFHIDNIPLVDLLDKFYNQQESLLNNWTCVLGSISTFAEIIKIKHLLGKRISDKEIRSTFPESCTDGEFEYELIRYRDELADPEIIIYCCATCGGHDCGGITVFIDRTDNSVTWKISDDNKIITFEFDKYNYYDVMNQRLKYLGMHI